VFVFYQRLARLASVDHYLGECSTSCREVISSPSSIWLLSGNAAAATYISPAGTAVRAMPVVRFEFRINHGFDAGLIGSSQERSYRRAPPPA
jgi:hypothetical protein